MEISYKSQKAKVTIPWAKLCQDPTSWITADSTPNGFQWADPSKIRIAEVFRLLAHWRHREVAGLEPLEWALSCPLLDDVEQPLMRGVRGRKKNKNRDKSDDEESDDMAERSTTSKGDDENDDHEGSSDGPRHRKQQSTHKQSKGSCAILRKQPLESLAGPQLIHCSKVYLC